MICKICSNTVKVTPKRNTLHHFFRLYQTHYEVLNLPQNCTAKQIKSAYIQLSKEHHPDVNKNTQSHVKFQQISEAYKVLGKAESRRSYDLGLAGHSQVRKQHYYYYEEAWRNPYDDPLFWANRNKTQDKYYNSRSYYGIDGIPRLSNGTILIFCVFFSLIGVGLQYLAITKSFTLRRDDIIRKSLEAEKVLNETREAASSNGNAVQLEALKAKLLGKVSHENNK